MYDIFYIGDHNLKERFPTAKKVETFDEAQKKCITKMFWLVWSDVQVSDDFEFSYKADDWSLNITHIFRNGEHYDGICLFPKNIKVHAREIEYRFFSEKKEVDIVASTPKPYDLFYVDSWEEYEHAIEHSSTEMFWAVSHNLKYSMSYINNFYFSHHNSYDRRENHAFVHRVDGKDLYNGVFLCSKHKPLNKRQIDYRFLVNAKQWEDVVSEPRKYEIYVINNYQEYLDIMDRCPTEMFWMIPPHVLVRDDFEFDTYFSHDNVFDRKINHVFKNGEYYDGVVLCSKHAPISEREFKYRFITNKKEHDVVASDALTYDKFVVNTYEEFCEIRTKVSTDFFYVVPNDVDVDWDFNYHIPYYERDNIHVFKNGNYHDGVFLIHKDKPLAQREFDYRFFVNKKEIDITVSTPKPFDLFYVETWQDYEHALANTTTDMFWAVSYNLEYNKDLVSTFYFSHHDSYDRKENHAFIHRVNGKDTYNGIFLLSKHKIITKREIEYRFLVNKKEWDIVGSGPTKYDIFTVDNYNDYKEALQSSKTEMFWAVRSCADTRDFDFDLYFNFDNKYDRETNHTFLHNENGTMLRNSVWLLSKAKVLSQKEIDYRFIVSAKEWDIVASKTKLYDQFVINSYKDYLYALENTTTEMFWCIPDDIKDIDEDIFELTYPTKNKFDTEYNFERNINHVYKNGKYNDGIILCSKNCKITEREFEFGFIVQKKEVDKIASSPKPYDVVFISYQEPNADENYKRLKQKIPTAKRIHGVKGIHQAHIEAAKISSTEMFWIVDGDAVIVEDFAFDYQVPKWQHDQVFVWHSKNPINDLVYGYGGVKLFPKKKTLEMDITSPDMTTSISSKFNIIDEVSNITAFNTGEFETWKSAFRECVKLASKIINRQEESETNARLQIWTTIGEDRKFGKFAISGARAGHEYGYANRNNPDALKMINDFSWLENKFKEEQIFQPTYNVFL